MSKSDRVTVEVVGVTRHQPEEEIAHANELLIVGDEMELAALATVDDGPITITFNSASNFIIHMVNSIQYNEAWNQY